MHLEKIKPSKVRALTSLLAVHHNNLLIWLLVSGILLTLPDLSWTQREFVPLRARCWRMEKNFSGIWKTSSNAAGRGALFFAPLEQLNSHLFGWSNHKFNKEGLYLGNFRRRIIWYHHLGPNSYLDPKHPDSNPFFLQAWRRPDARNHEAVQRLDQQAGWSTWPWRQGHVWRPGDCWSSWTNPGVPTVYLDILFGPQKNGTNTQTISDLKLCEV